MIEQVFVYGTLKRGFPNHQLMPTARFIGRAQTRDRYPLVVAGRWFSPVLLDEPGEGHHVRGELYEVDDVGLAALDELEGADLPVGYDRIRLEVVPEDGGEPTTVWTYAKPRIRLDRIHAGPLDEYRHDPRYVPGEARDGTQRGFDAGDDG